MRMYNQGNDEEEIMLQYAIRQSLGETGGESEDQVMMMMTMMTMMMMMFQVDIWEALEGLPPGHSRVNFQGEDRLLQQAIEASMSDGTGREPDTDSEISPQEDDLTGEVLDREGFVLCDANIVAFLFPSPLVGVDRR